MKLSLSEEMIVTGQTDIKKLDSKVRKVRSLLDGCMEGLEDKINFPIRELTCMLETEIRQLKVDSDSQLSELRQRFDEFENCDLVNINRRLGTAKSKINDTSVL